MHTIKSILNLNMIMDSYTMRMQMQMHTNMDRFVRLMLPDMIIFF
jgi:hypothetical protein